LYRVAVNAWGSMTHSLLAALNKGSARLCRRADSAALGMLREGFGRRARTPGG
jgi:hypothetical protein